MPRRAKIRSSFGLRLSQIRTAKGITQRELAKITGISPRMIAHYETLVQTPSVVMVTRITKALKITVDDLMGHKPLKIKDPLDRKSVKNAKLLGELSEKNRTAVLGLIKTLRNSQKSTAPQ